MVISEDDQDFWRRLLAADQVYSTIETDEDTPSHRQLLARIEFNSVLKHLLAKPAALIELIRIALQDPTTRSEALKVCAVLSWEEQQQLIGELLWLSSWSHESTAECQNLVQALPRPWVLGQVEDYAEYLLEENCPEVYGGLLKLSFRLDTTLTLRLVHRAFQTFGQDFGKQLQAS
ncbi:hypothetical protein [Candidatus Cyanaurora vandensis]|uniref:hypothetical protein n=1 Tax=Candidatus Cyanaurora vandensis TaxID=2714958 RepID=UPI00257C05F0|nr:hypothetical protein [Candidatus Cyanaurora vandensis]